MKLKRLLVIAAVLVTAFCLVLAWTYQRALNEARTPPKLPPSQGGMRASTTQGFTPDIAPPGVTAEAVSADVETSEGTIWGTVYTLEGQPAADADVQLCVCTRSTLPPLAECFTQRTNAAGTYRFEDIGRSGWRNSYGIVAQKENYIAYDRVRLGRAFRHRRVDLILMPGRPMAGQVLNDRGETIAGAVLVPMLRDGEELGRGVSAALTEHSGEDGHFRWKTLLAKSWQLDVYAKGYAPLIGETVETGREDLVLVLDQGQRIEGQVISAATGNPVSSLHVVARAETGEELRSQADQNGAFVIERVPPGSYELAIENPKWALVDGPVPVKVVRSEDLAGVVLKVGLAGRVGGLVRDARNETGVPGITVIAEGVSQGYQRVTTEKETDSAGEFEIAGLSPGDYGIRLVNLGAYAPVGKDGIAVHVSSGFTMSRVDFTVERGGMVVGGTVVDERHQPIAGAQVTGSGSSGLGPTGSREVTTISGKDGRFALKGFRWDDEVSISAIADEAESGPHGPYAVAERGRYGTRLRDQAERIVLTPQEIQNIEIEIKTRTQGLISGIVVDQSGNPTRARVEARNEASLDPNTNIVSVVTDGEGSFALPVPAPATYELTARRAVKGMLSRPGPAAEIKLGPGEPRSGIRLIIDPPGLSIQGRITNADGQPLVAHVNAKRGEVTYGAVSPPNGEYQESGLEQGNYDLTVGAANYLSTTREGVPAGTKNVDFVLSPFPELTGRVVNERTGNPVTEFEVCTICDTRRRDPPRCQRVLDPKGEFSVAARPYENLLTVRADGYLPGKLSFDPNASDFGQTPVVVSLTPGDLSIDGVVQDEGGKPVAGATVWAGDGAPRSRLQPRDSFVTGADGTFRLEAVPEETVEVVASHSDYATGTAPAQPQADVPLRVTVVLHAGGSLEGTARLDGQPLQGVLVSVFPRAAESATTDADGRYSLSNLPAGEYEMLAGYYDPESSDQHSLAIEQVAVVEPGSVTTADFEFPAGNKRNSGTTN